jgi:TP53 regulating kinase and related kinases
MEKIIHKNLNPGDTIELDSCQVILCRLLGKGKSGYSWLVKTDLQKYVLKIMHDEPCSYYHFSDNKVQLEASAYNTLYKLKIPVPLLIHRSIQGNYLLKEYIDGIVATEAIANQTVSAEIISSLYGLHRTTKGASINIDWFPANFVIRKNELYYIDYEVNEYSEIWDLPNWGAYYWANSKGMRGYLDSGDITNINRDTHSGVPHKDICKSIVLQWNSMYLYSSACPGSIYKNSIFLQYFFILLQYFLIAD